ncbi:hypothetical protein K1719_044944 [Acacia pycnantha]|nr:hypothetical protein K1719_044944 [Acacia pycnantha]
MGVGLDHLLDQWTHLEVTGIRRLNQISVAGLHFSRFQILAMAHHADGVGCCLSSSGSIKRWKYHVFLSFRGEDTRTNFTDHLYAALKRKGLKTFRDEEDLEKGQSIKPNLDEANEESRSVIVVLSPNYASSTWCLDELQKILDLEKESSLQVFPIFYGVDPSDVRKQKESFAEAFKKHEERFAQDKMKVQGWRNALEKVADISGWHSKNWHETDFIESIAEKMKSKLLDELPSDLGILTGIKPKLDELESIVASELEGVQFVGIWGIGGIGKTTLARAFYERKRKNFEIHCFLQNVREVHEKDGLLSLQRKLLFSLDKKSMEVDDCYEGKKLIRNLLCNRKLLLVLDDVSDISQLEDLAPRQGLFSEGSIIIITTRDNHLLSSHGVSAKYDVKFLSDNDSLELFLQKAFIGDKPNKDYLDLARSVIEYTGGLPLVLKVLGSFLCERTIEEWKDALAKFKKVPPNDILKILQVSFDGLDIKEKTIFLDIACFFNGMNKDYIIKILEILDKDLHPKIGIRVLIDKSIVIDSEGVLWVHEILKDMGQYIVCQESRDDAGKLSRILSLEDANHVLERNKGTKTIRGIRLMLEKSCDAFWDPEAFSNMSNLKLLIVSRYSFVSQYCQLNLPHGLKSLSKELKVIEWEGFPLFYLPSQTQLHELVSLYMPHSKLKELCRGRQSFRSLKFIDLSHSQDLRKTPNFDGIPHLEELILKGCSNLVEIHQSLGHHHKLVIVDLKDCRKLKTLPRKFEMNRLETFVLSGCSKVRKLCEFGKEMERLSKLDLEGTAIAKLPQSLGNLIGLVELNLKDCKSLFCLPNSVCKFKALKIIRIGCSKLSRLPENLIENEALEMLDLSKIAIKGLSLCECNREVQYSSSWSCFSLLQRPSSPTKFMLLPSLSSLNELKLSFCNLRDGSLPDDISELSSLRRLFLGGNNFIDLPSGLISNLSKLQLISLPLCPWLRSLPQLPSNLLGIYAIGCSSMRHYESSRHLWDFIESFQPQQALNLGEVVDLNIKSTITTSGSRIPFDFFWHSTRSLFIQGREVPSWFYNQNYFDDKGFEHPNVSFIISIPPHYCDSSEWWGIAICLVIEHDFSCKEGWDWINLTFGYPNHGFPNKYFQGHPVYLRSDVSHQINIIYIRWSCLVVDGLQMTFFSNNAITNKSPAFKIRKCGWRAVCKEDVEAWRRTRDKGCSSNISVVENYEGYTHCPTHHDQFKGRKIIVEVDGTYCHLNDKAACGGVLKNGNNCMKEAFLLKLSAGDTLTAKLWVREMHKDIAVIMEIKGMLEWNWCVKVLVVHRDSNGDSYMVEPCWVKKTDGSTTFQGMLKDGKKSKDEVDIDS